MYKTISMISGSDKIDCITQIAKYISELGVPRKYIGKNGNANTGYNPFEIVVESQYPPNTLNLVYEFSNTSYGYIVRIEDNGEIKTMNPAQDKK